MKKLISSKKFRLIVCVLVVLVLAGCQRNVDNEGHTLAERIIYMTTPWSDMFDESILTAILVYPLAQCINYIGHWTGSAVLGVALTTVLFNLLTLGMTIKSSVNTQKMQMLKPEQDRIQAKYAGRNDENSRMQMSQELMALYNKHGVNPMRSFVQLLQFPILISMFYAAQRAEIVVNGTVLGTSLQTTPWDAFANPGKNWPLILIFILMAITQLGSTLIPQKIAEMDRKKRKGYKAYADEGPKDNQMNIMMYSMLGMVVLLGLRWPTTMSLYWACSSLVNILKTIFIQRRYVSNEKI